MTHRLKQLTLIIGDFAAFYAGLYLSVAFRYQSWPNGRFDVLIAPFTTLFVVAALIYFIVGLYDTDKTRNTTAFYQKIIVANGVWLLVGIIYFYLNPLVTITPKTILLINVALSIILVSGWRYMYNLFLSTRLGKIAVVFVGVTPEAAELIATLSNEPERGYVVAGVVTPEATEAIMHRAIPNAPTLTALLAQNPHPQPGLIVVAPNAGTNEAFVKECYRALLNRIGIIDLAELYESVYKRLPPFTFSEAWFISHLQEQYKKMYDRLRVLIDYTAAFLLAILFAAVYVPVALILKLTSPGPVLFKQARVGRSGSPFTIYKFRTMQALSKDGSAETAGPQFAKSNDSRITAIGKFLRKTRIDEIPQFINILRGEMAIIGPRPERPEFVSALTDRMPFYALRHLIRPGLMGWAQLHKEYYGNIEENLLKLEYDLYYVKNRSFLLDMTIVLKTIAVIVRMRGR